MRFALVIHATVEYMNEVSVEVEADTLDEAAAKAHADFDYSRAENECPTVTRYGQIYQDLGEGGIDDSKPLKEI